MILATILGSVSQDNCCGYETLSVGSAAAVTLTVPSSANRCLISVEADATSADLTKAVRFLETGGTPTASSGTPLGNLDVYESKTHGNMANFKVIGIESGKTHSLKISYYQ